MYASVTIYKDGSLIEDTKCFVYGLEHAKRSCLHRLENPAVDFILLLGTEGNDNHVIKREVKISVKQQSYNLN